MKLEQQRWEDEFLTSYVDEIILRFYGNGIPLGTKVNLRKRIKTITKTNKLAEKLIEKLNDLKPIEINTIKEQIEQKTPVEQLLLYINAPRTSETEETREDMHQRWLSEDVELQAKNSKDYGSRTSSFVAGYGTLFIVAPWLIIKVAGMAISGPTGEAISQTADQLTTIAQHYVGELTPYLSGSAVLGFIAPLFVKYHEQRVMNELVLGKHYQPTELTTHLQNSPKLRAKLAEFNPAEQVLLQHLVTSTSDEKLRMFLLTDKEARAEMLNRYPQRTSKE